MFSKFIISDNIFHIGSVCIGVQKLENELTDNPIKDEPNTQSSFSVFGIVYSIFKILDKIYNTIFIIVLVLLAFGTLNIQIMAISELIKNNLPGGWQSIFSSPAALQGILEEAFPGTTSYVGYSAIIYFIKSEKFPILAIKVVLQFIIIFGCISYSLSRS